MNKKNFLVLLFLAISTLAFSQNGTVKGILTEEQNGQQIAMPFANVFLEGTTLGATSDFDGNFSFSAPEGSYVLTCSFMGYETFKRQIIVTGGGEVTINIEMKPEGIALEGVKVEAKMNRESEIANMMEQKKAEVIKESIGAKRLSTMGVSDAAAATTKISGVTQSEGSGDVYVRGLGDRYLSTTMNGLPIPSDDIEKKNIDLKLFSTDVIKNVGISKTYSVDNYVDQTSGNIDITSKTQSDGIQVALATGLNSNLLTNGTFGAFKATQNMNDISLGFYSKPYETQEAKTKQSWNTVDGGMPLKYDFSLLAGHTFEFGGLHKISMFGTLAHAKDFEYYEGRYNKYRMNTDDKLFPFTENFSTKYNTTGLANITYELGVNHEFKFNSLYVVKTIDELYEAGREGESSIRDETDQDGDNLTSFVRDQNIKETRLFINQLHGQHQIGFRNNIKWAIGLNKVKADEPNRIHNESYISSDPVYNEFASVGDAQQRKSHQYIEDKEINGFLKEEFKIIDEESKKIKLNTGINYRNKTRDFYSQYFGVRARLVQFASIDNMDEILADESIYGSTILDRDQVFPDTYNAKLNVVAGYLNAGFTFADISGTLGLRYEQDQIDVAWDVANYRNATTGKTRVGDLTNNYDNLLPSLNLKYQLTEKNAVRLAISKTLTLPEFKELAPFEYVSQEGDVTAGNDTLKNSVNYNVDIKWEMFPTPKELISVAAFYKQINDPINRTQKTGSSGVFYFNNTGEQANVYGFEFEGRFNILKPSEKGMPKLNLVVNATRMWHSMDIADAFQYYYHVEDENTHIINGEKQEAKAEVRLQGASDFIFNSAATYSSNTENELKATVTANYSSDKVFSQGVPEDYVNRHYLFNDEIIEKGFWTVDLIVSKKLSERITIKATGKNLLNPSIERTQDVSNVIAEKETSSGVYEYTYDTQNMVVRSYKKGISFGLGVTINLN